MGVDGVGRDVNVVDEKKGNEKVDEKRARTRTIGEKKRRRRVETVCEGG